MYGSFSAKALLDWRIEMMSTSGAMPLNASAGPGLCAGAAGGGGGGGLGFGSSGRGLAGLSTAITRPPRVRDPSSE